MIHNPVLRGFNPDPSILRVGADYYIATSTFEWYPGIQLHHSTDLVNWRLLPRPLRRPSQLDLRGVPDSCGVWAPCLSHDGRRFYLTYSLVRRYGRTTRYGAEGSSLRDFSNFVISCDSIEGEWSDPVFLNSSGFDPSLFHDRDGKTYLLNLLWDHRSGHDRFGGILMQEYRPDLARLVGEPQMIFRGTELGFTEGPHLYRRGDWCYLIVAEGGTGWNHAVTLARAKDIHGPYAPCPHGPILTSRGCSGLALQRAGHGDLVQTQDGQWLIAYLCARPEPETRRSVLGRETAIQPVEWTPDGWIRPAPPLEAADNPVAPEARGPKPSARRYAFSDAALPPDFQWLRSPQPETLFSLTQRPGHLTLIGRETIGSQFEQSLVARRLTALTFEAVTRLDYDPSHFQQSAGLVCYYNASKFHYLYLSQDDEAGRHLRVMSALPDPCRPEAHSRTYPVGAGPVELRAVCDGRRLRFGFRLAGAADWTDLDEVFDATLLSDEMTLPGDPGFTGAFVGMACQDMSGQARPAHFAWFDYRDFAAGAPAALSDPAPGAARKQGRARTG